MVKRARFGFEEGACGVKLHCYREVGGGVPFAVGQRLAEERHEAQRYLVSPWYGDWYFSHKEVGFAWCRDNDGGVQLLHPPAENLRRRPVRPPAVNGRGKHVFRFFVAKPGAQAVPAPQDKAAHHWVLDARAFGDGGGHVDGGGECHVHVGPERVHCKRPFALAVRERGLRPHGHEERNHGYVDQASALDDGGPGLVLQAAREFGGGLVECAQDCEAIFCYGVQRVRAQLGNACTVGNFGPRSGQRYGVVWPLHGVTLRVTGATQGAQLTHYDWKRTKALRVEHTMVNVAGASLGQFHGLVEEAIDRSRYTFITVETIVKQTSLRLLDVRYVLADMRDQKMITITENRVSFTAAMRAAKAMPS